MKKYRLLTSILLILTILLAFPLTVFANSSWHWISETRPYDVLPIVVILTLVIEVSFIYLIAKVKPLPKLIFVVLLANVLSFAAPYIFVYTTPSLVYTFEQNLENTPFYTVGIIYLLTTVIIEVPIVYYLFKKSSTNTKKLLYSIIGANIITTIITAIIERTVCTGAW